MDVYMENIIHRTFLIFWHLANIQDKKKKEYYVTKNDLSSTKWWNVWGRCVDD